jgi:hypothetical protein
MQDNFRVNEIRVCLKWTWLSQHRVPASRPTSPTNRTGPTGWETPSLGRHEIILPQPVRNGEIPQRQYVWILRQKPLKDCKTFTNNSQRENVGFIFSAVVNDDHSEQPEGKQGQNPLQLSHNCWITVPRGDQCYWPQEKHSLLDLYNESQGSELSEPNNTPRMTQCHGGKSLSVRW